MISLASDTLPLSRNSKCSLECSVYIQYGVFWEFIEFDISTQENNPLLYLPGKKSHKFWYQIINFILDFHSSEHDEKNKNVIYRKNST